MLCRAIKQIKFIFVLITILKLNNVETMRIKLTKIVCNVTDATYFTAEACRIKAESRNLQYVNIYIKLLQPPIKDFNIRLRFMKIANGYKPFLYDFTVHCSFVKHLNPVSKIVWGWIKDMSNLNHSCPITEDFEIKRLENRYLEQQLKSLPVAAGDYALFISFSSLNVSRLYMEIYATVN